MNQINNIPIIPRTGIIEKKQSKNKKIMLWSGIGLTILTVSVSLPFGFLTNFNKAIAPPPVPPPPVIDYPYDKGTILYAKHTDFIAYYVRDWKTKSLVDIDINLISKSAIPENDITLDNLANIGIVPQNETWKSWYKVISSPIFGSDTSFLISIFLTIGSTTPVSYPVTIPTDAITPSTFYDVNTPYVEASNDDYYAYKMKTLGSLTLSNFYSTYTHDSIDSNFLINIKNLEKIGIVPRNDNYKSWVSIKLFPISSSTIKVTIQKTSSQIVSYTFSGFTTSTIYDINRIIFDKNPEFIMYLPNNWPNIYPADASIKLTSNPLSETLKQISLATLEKIGIVPLTLDFKTWTSVTVMAVGSKTCKVIIKKNNDTVDIATINVNYFKSNDTLYDTAIILTESKLPDYNFIWYRPKIWDITLLPNNVNINLSGSDITLSNLENIGIVPLDNSYKSWHSITKTDIKHGLQGKIGISIRTTNSQIVPLVMEIDGFKQSIIYDSSIILEETANYIRFMPISFKNPTQVLWDYLVKTVQWRGPNINLSNLEIIGLVPLNENYKQWTSVQFGGEIPPSGQVVISIYPGSGQNTIRMYYPFAAPTPW